MDAGYHLVKDKMVFFGMPDTIITPKHVFKTAFSQLKDDQDGILCLFKAEKPEKSGMVRTDNNQVIEIVDKPPQTDLEWMWGCIIWRPRFTEYLHAAVCDGRSDFAAIMNGAIQAGLRFRGVPMARSSYIYLGTYEEIMELDQRMREG